MSAHDLTIDADAGGGTCGCGETFTGAPGDVVTRWEAHAKSLDLLATAREHMLAERAARAAGEDAIRALLALGIPARRVSAAIGHDEHGRLLASPTLVLRLGRDEHVQTPRRRRR